MAQVATPWQTAVGTETALTLDLTALSQPPVAPGSESGVLVRLEDQGIVTGTQTVTVSNTLITSNLRAGFTPNAGERYRAEYFTNGATIQSATPTGGALSDITDIARTMVAVETAAVLTAQGKTDPYAAYWNLWIGNAITDIVTDLVTEGGLVAQTEAAINITGAARYDLSAFGLLRIDSIFYGTSTNRTEIPIVDREQAYAWNANPGLAGTPFQAYRDGMQTVGLYNVPTDTTQFIYVEGPALPAAISGSVGSGLPPIFNECIAAGAARRACNFDRFNPERVQALPYVDSEFKRLLSNLRSVLSEFTTVTPGFKVVGNLYGGPRRMMRGYGYGRHR